MFVRRTWFPVVLLLLWFSLGWGEAGIRLQNLVMKPTPIEVAQPRGREEVTGEKDMRSDQEEAKTSSGALDLDQIKQTLDQFRVHQEKEVPEPQPQPPGERMELTLQRSLEIALMHNLRIQIAKLTRDAVQTEIPRAKAKFHPIVGVSFIGSGEESSSADEIDSESNDLNVTAFISEEVPTGARLTLSGDLTGQEETRVETLPRRFRSDLLISVVQPLLQGGWIVVTTRRIRDAAFDLRIEEARLRADILRVTANTKSAYYTMLLAEKIIEVTAEAVQRDQTLVEASQALFKAGLVTKRDVFSAEIILAQDSARLVSAQADLESAKNILLDVLGLPFATTVLLLDKDISFQPVSLALDMWITTAIEHRPEILEIEEELGKSWLNIRVEKNALLPRLDLVASYERFQGDSTLGEAFDFSGEGWSAGLVFSVPIGNVAAKSTLARAEIEHARLQQRLVQTKRQIELEVRAAVIKLSRSLERMKVLIAGVEQAQGKLEFAKARFVLGLATNLDITDVQEDLLDAETDLLSAIVGYNIGLAELEARIAGPM
jgi:outer membrane protein TolC